MQNWYRASLNVTAIIFNQKILNLFSGGSVWITCVYLGELCKYSAASLSRNHWGDGRPELQLGLGTSLFRAHLTFFHFHSFSAFLLPLFLCFLSFLLFSCSSVWENTRAWIPLFLWKYWMDRAFFALMGSKKNTSINYWWTKIFTYWCTK